MLSLKEALADLAARRTDEAVIATMSACIHWPPLSRSDRDLAYYAPMGSAAAVGLGLALARPDVRVVVLDGDGSLLMNLGVLVTVAAHRPDNLLHVVLNNGKYDVTGGQPIPGPNSLRLAGLARAAGILLVHEVDSRAEWATLLDAALIEPGCRFVNVAVSSRYDRAEVARILSGPDARRRHTHQGFWNLHRSLTGE